ncbi:putative zinc finger protein [Natranaerovirga pectinivora]|uniref:Anti-sigma-W factor RsiW n=1 Tax=Natranaerovirga pectinivora TaxID=682400 RepID=A0A4R3MS96_9FIRM|nr:zf-HC2 domain-containing protein [Natranaerovirga pectinivora]TCT17098.1 putative zinc finger protein [Natranaerovirga pectinivora]
MNCNKVQSLISLYLDNSLSEIEKLELEKHIENCPSCKEEVRTYAFLMSELSHLDDEKDLPEHYHKDLMSKLKNTSQKKKRFNYRPYISSAAAIILVVLVVSIFSQNNPLDFKGGTEEIAFDALESEGETDFFTTAEGARTLLPEVEMEMKTFESGEIMMTSALEVEKEEHYTLYIILGGLFSVGVVGFVYMLLRKAKRKSKP